MVSVFVLGCPSLVLAQNHFLQEWFKTRRRVPWWHLIGLLSEALRTVLVD